MNAARVAVLTCAVAVASGCGAAGGGGRATVWVTRDRGAHLLHAQRVPAGLTAMQALARVAKVKTRYGGRFVVSIDGITSAPQRDWFYYVNGYLADRGAAEYRLRAGDVEWWDYRRWSDAAEDPVVVGAFPEPFLHGYDGKRRPSVVVTRRDAPRAAVARLARLIRASRITHALIRVPHGTNVLLLMHTRGLFFQAEPVRPVAGGRVVFVYSGDVSRLARHPHLARFRYGVP